MNFKNTLLFAQKLDRQDKLNAFQSNFIFPKKRGEKCIYMAGHSLGLQPKNTKKYVDEVLDSWGELAVDGHFKGDNPWSTYHEKFKEPLAKIVGAKPEEVTVMNTLSVNLHLLLASFYRPTVKRFKILCEEKAFPSDQYILESQVKWHGLDPKDVIEVIPYNEEGFEIRTETILNKIEELGDSLALVFMGGVHYYLGQVMDIEKITKAGQAVGAKVGWDLAHAAGNISLELNSWNVDFAAWCSYKYMNSGPGSISGVYVSERYHQDASMIRLAGWWGNKKETRFLMKPYFEPETSADGWQLSNIPILSMVPYYASLLMFDKVGMESLIRKRDKITAYLDFVVEEVNKVTPVEMRVITPKYPKRACQISIFFSEDGRAIFEYLEENGVIADWREPNVIRMAPVPFYTSYEDIYRIGTLLKEAVDKIAVRHEVW
ncbi:kynureninase [Pseudofulvibacter geojedonensis]|uniref:Kynureninase n=1 Tax=Pseudofulvibacter geojedonensis TaxID=1123758 RepID=A0ABW3I060_9FLAO